MAERLHQAELQRKHIMQDVAHELRTLLSNIQGYLEAVQNGLLEADGTTVDTIHGQVMQLTTLMEDLRLLARAEAGALGLNRQPESIEDLLRGSVAAFRPRAEAKGIALALEMPSRLPVVEMDRTRIAQVVGNLIENAIVHPPAPGRVTVSAAMASPATVRITVADTGEGIPAELLPHVFERFYRVDPSRARTTGGDGLGLTIARQMVGLHGGAIRVESAPGEGSRFIVELPVSGPAIFEEV